MNRLLHRARPLLLTAALACKPATPAPAPAAPPPADLLATVNGVPIRDAELQMFALTSARRNVPDSPTRAQDTLDVLVTQELLAQQALALGLDRDPRYAEQYSLAEARHALWRRKELAAMAQRNLVEKTAISDEDARKYYEANAAMVRSEYDLLRLARHGEPVIQQVLADLKTGKTFEALAAAMFPELPAGQKPPWQMGWVSWAELPLDWRTVVPSLAVGATSAPLKGVGTQFWLVHVKEKRENPALTFDKQKAAIVEVLRVTRNEEAQKRLEAELRGRAVIQQARPPVLAPPRNRADDAD
ncbi:MAG: peptidyl-prolyl cis-trans isomerase [Deltaproteobacteria bacterium]|nr:peptidyl-prolyl cis-trans isomerase [Deltaproteobacteria bacterium]